MKLLTAFYDLAIAPVSYDFFKFLAAVNSIKRAFEYDLVHVVFVPAETETGFRIDHKPTTTDNKVWRLHNLCVPLCRLIGATYTVAWSREFAGALRTVNIWPIDWTPERPTTHYWFAQGRDVIGK